MGREEQEFLIQGTSLSLFNRIQSSFERTKWQQLRFICQFVKMRKMISSHNELFRKISEIEKSISDLDEKILLIFQTIKELLEPGKRKRRPIGFRISK